jgi:hypothetical protein
MTRTCKFVVLLISPALATGLAQAPENVSGYSPSSSHTESSIFYFLNMSGRTQKDFRPLTAKEKAKFAERGVFGPVAFFTAGAAAGISQWKDVPAEWGQGAEGYADRYANYFGKQIVQRTLRLAGEDLLHEDNRYYGSGERGFGRRLGYALKSSIMARSNDGHQHISVSQIGSIAGSAFISRLWQPPSTSSMSDGATSFGLGMATNAAMHVLREFLPDVTRHVFHRSER